MIHSLCTQAPQKQDENAARMAAGSMPIFRVSVTGRTAKAINYQHRSGATKVDFRGTALMPEARGEAKVESKQGYIEVEVEFDDLQGATRFGPEYLTYVMWAITPEGRATNLGEVILNGTKSKLNVTTELQTFGLIVTAEPYFAVAQPSDVVVMENIIRKDTEGKVEEVDAKYELLQRGQSVQRKRVVEKRVAFAQRSLLPIFLLAALLGGGSYWFNFFARRNFGPQQSAVEPTRRAEACRAIRWAGSARSRSR